MSSQFSSTVSLANIIFVDLHCGIISKLKNIGCFTFCVHPKNVTTLTEQSNRSWKSETCCGEIVFSYPVTARNCTDEENELNQKKATNVVVNKAKGLGLR